jgi:hypothetical protein
MEGLWHFAYIGRFCGHSLAQTPLHLGCPMAAVFL